jgi:hypothetical protein
VRLGVSGSVLAVLVLAALRCAHAPPRPIDFGTRGRLENPETALESIMSRRDRVKTVRGEGKFSIDSPQGSGKFNAFVEAQWPAQMRLETVTFFGNPVAVLTSDGTHFALNDIEHRQFLEGLATAENVSRLLPVRLKPEDITALLIGVPPIPPTFSDVHMELDEPARAYALSLGRGAATEVVGLDPATLQPVWVRVNRLLSPTAYEAFFENYEKETDLPRVVRLVTEDPKATVELRWQDRQVNGELPLLTFTQSPPAGVTPTTMP